jgi:hypothetical protein
MILLTVLDQSRDALGHLGEVLGHQDVVPWKDQVNGGL